MNRENIAAIVAAGEQVGTSVEVLESCLLFIEQFMKNHDGNWFSRDNMELALCAAYIRGRTDGLGKMA